MPGGRTMAVTGEASRLGSYELIEHIATGGMGAVYRAHDTARRELVAVKVMLDDLENQSRWRFQREARLAASLWHRNIVRVRDHGRRDVHGEEQLFLVMDLVEGTTVGHMLRRVDEVPLGVWCALVCQLLDALSYVHARDVLHRDIKPSNLLVERAPGGELTLKVVDFGLAMELGSAMAKITAWDQVMGTPTYMAPEQASGDELLGPAADLYAVGVLLFQVLVGAPPFEGNPASVLLAKVRELPPLERLPTSAPEPLRRLIGELLELAPERRPPSAAAARARLLPFAAPAHLDAETWAAFGVTAVDPDALSTIAASGVAAGRRPRDRDAPRMWGRDRERRELEALAEAAFGGSPRVVVIEGDVGLGKSELAQELSVRLREQGRFRVVRASDLDRGVLRAMRAAIEHTLRTTSLSREVLERALRALIRRAGSDEGELRALMHLLRPDVAADVDPQPQNLAALARFFRCLAFESPVMLVIEDAHAGGEDAGALLRHLLFDIRSDPYPLLLVVTQRSEPKRRDHSAAKVLRELEATRPETLVRIDLRPLDDEVLRAGLAQEYDVDATRREEIVAAAAGNPAFARMLAGVEMLPGEPTAGGPESTLPRQLRATLAVMLEERLDRADDRDSLQELLLHLALLGGESTAQLLAAFVDADASAIADAIDALVELQLVSEPAIDRLRLTYPMMRELLLDQATPRRLRRLHLRAAELRSQTEADVGEVGDHLFAAGDESAAVAHWLRAQRSAFDFGDCRQAAQWGRKALAHLSPGPPAHFEASVLLARALREMTAYAEAARVLVPLVEQDGPSPERFRAAELLGEVLQEQGDDEGWARCVARVEADLPQEPGLARRAALRTLAFWSNHRLDLANAQRYAEEALIGDDLGVDERATAYKRLFWALFYQVEFDRALSVARCLRSLGEETGRVDIEAEGLRLVGKIHQETPAFDESIAAFEGALALYRRSGRQSRIINVYLDIMFVACTAERWDQARDYVERFERVRSTTVLDYTGVIVRMTELRCRGLGRHEPVAEPLAALDAHVRSTSWGFRAAVRGEWLAALVREGRADDARPMLADLFESVKTLPPLVWIATHLEHFAEALAASADDWRRASAITSLELAAMVYRRLGNEERAKNADAKRAHL